MYLANITSIMSHYHPYVKSRHDMISVLFGTSQQDIRGALRQPGRRLPLTVVVHHTIVGQL
jgi:hypothetical protein